MANIKLSFILNRKPYTVETDPGKRMLDVLREDLGLMGTKEGCGVGECGACTGVLNGKAVTCCRVRAVQMQEAEILTFEGMRDDEIGRVIQDCFIEGGAVQCGFCTPGFIMSAYALLLENPNPTREEIRLATAGNLCRCTGYDPITDAIEKAAKTLAK